MLKIETYRLNLSIGILCFFLVGIFHQPILEGVHFLSHLDDFSKGKLVQHSLNSHDSSHNHQVIYSLIDEKIPQSSNTPNKQPTNKKAKKIKQFCYRTNSSEIRLEPQINSLEHLFLLPESIFSKVPSPPPKGIF
jgi:hypothetical protein